MFFSLIHWFFSLSNFVIPSKCLKNYICAASKRCSSLFFSTQVSLPNFNAAVAAMLWILNFVSLFIFFPKCLLTAPFILLYVCNLSSKSLFLFWYTVPHVFKICYLFNNIVVYYNFDPLYVVPTHCHWFCFGAVPNILFQINMSWESRPDTSD